MKIDVVNSCDPRRRYNDDPIDTADWLIDQRILPDWAAGYLVGLDGKPKVVIRIEGFGHSGAFFQPSPPARTRRFLVFIDFGGSLTP